MTRAFARRLCPDLIIHPHPVSDVNPAWSTSWVRSRTARDIEDNAFGSCDLGINGKFERYVSHILASKSSKKDEGHPPSFPFPDSPGVKSESMLLAVLSGGVTGWVGLVSCGGELAIVEASDFEAVLYSLPRHHIGESEAVSAVGSGSQM